MNDTQFNKDWCLIQGSAEFADQHHVVRGLDSAIERLEKFFNLVFYNDLMVNERIYDSCLEGGHHLEIIEKTCFNDENTNIVFPTIHPSLTSEEISQAIKFANILVEEYQNRKSK